MRIDFRQITNNDLEFLWKLHNLALKDYVAQTWDWDEDWQRLDFTEKFNPADGKIIIVAGVDAGFWQTIERKTETLLVSIRILPEFQNRGIGTKIIKNLLTESKNPVRLQVLKVNPARRLYEKLGFEIFDETETHFKMIRRRD